MIRFDCEIHDFSGMSSDGKCPICRNDEVDPQ